MENPFPRPSCKLKQSHKSPSEKPIQLKLPSDHHHSWQGLELPLGRQITCQIVTSQRIVMQRALMWRGLGTSSGNVMQKLCCSTFLNCHYWIMPLMNKPHIHIFPWSLIRLSCTIPMQSSHLEPHDSLAPNLFFLVKFISNKKIFFFYKNICLRS